MDLRGFELPGLALSYDHFSRGSFQQLLKEISKVQKPHYMSPLSILRGRVGVPGHGHLHLI